MKRFKRALDVILDCFRDYEFLYYSAIALSPVTWVVVVLCVFSFPFIWLWNNGIQNLIFYWFKYDKMTVKNKKRLLEVWNSKDFKSKFNKYIWYLTIKKIRRDISA